MLKNADKVEIYLFSQHFDFTTSEIAKARPERAVVFLPIIKKIKRITLCEWVNSFQNPNPMS